MLGGTVGSGVVGGEYGRMPILIQPGSRLYSFQDNSKPNVWMSHGDEATKLPEGFHVVAKSEQVGFPTSWPCVCLALTSSGRSSDQQ
jgi:GMP synthase (glutamine-hydrolysing)